MSKSVNEVILLGHLGRDAEQKFIPSGVAVSNFSIATDRRVKKGDEYVSETDWHDVVCWQTEGIQPYLVKGKQLFVRGRLQTRSWDDKDGTKKYRTEIICNSNDVILLHSGDGTKSQSPVDRAMGAASSGKFNPAIDDGLDIPF